MGFKAFVSFTTPLLLAIATPSWAESVLDSFSCRLDDCKIENVRPSDADKALELFLNGRKGKAPGYLLNLEALKSKYATISTELNDLIQSASNDKAREDYKDILGQLNRKFEKARSALSAGINQVSPADGIAADLRDLEAFIRKAKTDLGRIPSSHDSVKEAAAARFSQQLVEKLRRLYNAEYTLRGEDYQNANFKVDEVFTYEYRYFDTDQHECFLYTGQYRDDERTVHYRRDWIVATIDPVQGPMKLKCFKGNSVANLFRKGTFDYKYDARAHLGSSRYGTYKHAGGMAGSHSSTRYHYTPLAQVLEATAQKRQVK
jgi:hypothetical protein